MKSQSLYASPIDSDAKGRRQNKWVELIVENSKAGRWLQVGIARHTADMIIFSDNFIYSHICVFLKYCVIISKSAHIYVPCN